jgi:ribosome-binding factor A
MVDAPRARRLAKRIATIVASAIEYEIKDPPLAFITVTDAKVTGDLHDATVFYTVRGTTLDDEPDYSGAAAALERAKGTLRTKVGAGTGVRFTPTLTFVLDKVPDTAHRMEELLARARAADADLARVRQGAKPAGDADPYRISGEEGLPREREVPPPARGECGGDLDDTIDAEDPGDRDQPDD